MNSPKTNNQDNDLDQVTYGDAVMPIAIVGISGRFPGDAENPKKLWDMIEEGRSALSDIPADRFNVDAFYHPHNERQGTFNVRKGHFMKRDMAAFDAPFFNIPVAEAKAMDPQQRMSLECAYEALENAGMRMEDVQGSNTSCFVGCFVRDYASMLRWDREDVPMYYGLGAEMSMLSNRVSWFFNMKGPSLTVDTACSSSMTALHLACQGLRAGECTMTADVRISCQAVVGGTNFMLLPEVTGGLARLHFLSPDGKSQAFDHKANGYSRGEGTAFCVLKPLHLALENGDVIRGVIRNTGANQDGKTPGITLPSAEAQQTLIRRVYTEANLDLSDTAYVEAHGTGTAAGDPVEAAALGATFGKARGPGKPLYMGSVKSNVGHLESAAGLIQVVKAVMMLEKGLIPPSIWFEKPNPRIPMDQWNLAVPTELMAWPTEGPRRISINSFGYGGSNAHCIVDDAYSYLKTHRLVGNHNVQSTGGATPDSSTDSGVEIVPASSAAQVPAHELSSPKLLVFTSHEQAGIKRTAQVYSEYLAARLKEDMNGLGAEDDKRLLSQFARTLATRRSVLPWKCFTVAGTCAEASEMLEKPAILPLRAAATKKPPNVGLVFTGQGAQWYAMGRELLSQPVFRACLEAASGFFAKLGASWCPIGEISRDEKTSRLESADLSQPICTALQIALVDLFQHWKVEYSAVVGHSSGEIAAAYAKGALTREDAWAIAYHRGRLSSRIRSFAPELRGAMLATGLGPEDAERYISRLIRGTATVACVNSPSSTTLSGDAGAVDELERAIKADGHFARKLRVDVAYHSPHMQVIARRYLHALGNIVPLAEEDSRVHMFSSLTGKEVKNADLGPQYWVSNLTGQVNFTGAVLSMLSFSENIKGVRRGAARKKAFVQHLIEVGPHAALKGPLKQILDHESIKQSASDLTYDAILQRGKDACETALTVAGRLFQFGLPVDLARINGDPEPSSPSDAFLVDLPPFAWNHTLKYWWESPLSKAHRLRSHPRHDLLGAETLELVPDEPRFRNILRVAEVPWVQDHKVQGSILYPAAGMMVMAIQAMWQKADGMHEIEGYELRDVLISKAVVVPDDEGGVETMLSLKPFRLGSQALTAVWQEFRLHSRRDEEWRLNCAGLIRIKYKAGAALASRAVFADEEALAAEGFTRRYRQLEEGCSRTQKPRHFYEHLTSIGVQYGPVFQNMVDIRKGDFQSVCKVQIPETRSTMPHGFEYPHVIHPATLDGIFQLAIPACTGADEDLTAAMVPTAIGRLYVAAAMPSEPGLVLAGYSSGEETGAGTREGYIALGELGGVEKPLVIVEGIKSAAVSSSTSGDEAAASLVNLRKLITVPCWGPDISLLEPAQVEALCAAAVGDRGRVERRVLEELEMACLIIIKRVMRDCSREEAKGFAWHCRLFWEYMEQCYERGKAGKLCYQTPGRNWLGMKPEDEDALLARVSAATADGMVIVEHGKHLPAILRGMIPPLQVLMHDNLLHNYYNNSVGGERHSAQMTFYIDQLAHKNPNMKILEIGAGTGSATLPILETLGGNHGTAPRFESYTFTDISIGFFEKAKETLAPWVPFMKFAPLNIEEDPLTQGSFEEGDYDLIVASNVLHATRSIQKTLENTRKLLKPNGKLVLSEVTNPAQKMRFHMIVGSLEGWWYGEEDGRHNGPVLTVDEWHEKMLKAGFDGVEIGIANHEDERDLSLSVMVTSPTAPELPSPPKSILIVLPSNLEPDVCAFAEKMGTRLRAMGSARVVTLKLQEVASLRTLDGFSSCLLLLDAQRYQAFLTDVSEKDWVALKKLVLHDAWDVTYVTRGGTVESDNPLSNAMTGLARSIRSENPGLSFATLDLDYNKPLDTEDTVTGAYKAFVTVCASRGNPRADWEYAVRDGVPMVQRALLEKGMNDLALTHHVLPKPEPGPFKQPGRPLRLEVGTPGRLDTLQFNDDKTAAEEVPLEEHEVEIEIKAAGLNFKDVMVAMGQLVQPALGVDASGVVRRVGRRVRTVRPGDAVMTAKLGAFGNFVRASEAMVQLIPAGMDFVTAASFPVIYTTAHYALSHAARLRKGESLLIHGAAGGVGQAAVMLAQHIDAEVFVTVSSEAKKKLLMDLYGIPENHIFSSRDNGFVQGIQRLTGGRGVDVVLNSLAGEALRLSWGCIARFGRFVEMGMKDIVGNTGLDMAPFERNASFHAINLADILDHQCPIGVSLFAEVMELLRQGIAKPIAPVVSLPFSRIEEAFRMMQTGKHMGKIVLEAVNDDIVSVIPPAVQAARFEPDATYVIAGGSGGLGRCIAEWMVRLGARNILLLSRSGSSKQTVRDLLTRLAKLGARALAPPCDVGNREDLRRVLEQHTARGWPKVRGVIQGAMVLRDAIYQNMTREQFLGTTHGKVQGSWNLHELLPADVDFFVLLSSFMGIVGGRGQGNYAAGNSYQDALAHYRCRRGLKACTIDLGMILGVGFLAEETTEERVHDHTKTWAFLGVRERELLGILQAAITGRSMPEAGTLPPQLIMGLGTGGMVARGGGTRPWWFDDVRFAHIVQVDTHQVAWESSEDTVPLQVLLQQATNLDEASETVTAALVKKLAKSMMVSVEDIDASRLVSSYGVDSLLAVELRTWIFAEMQSDISVFDLLSNISISSLARKIALVSKAVPASALALE
ncbi:hypothetical protein N0V88_005683 [Collariella sp. IMI 366227]|nr:hypothetical protein N0V88_005683 [Collariella sp. IMI 366227]